MNEELLEKLRSAKTAEEVIALGKEYGKELTKELLEMTGNGTGELSDEELEAVAGGDIWDKLCEFFGGFF